MPIQRSTGGGLSQRPAEVGPERGSQCLLYCHAQQQGPGGRRQQVYTPRIPRLMWLVAIIPSPLGTQTQFLILVHQFFRLLVSTI